MAERDRLVEALATLDGQIGGARSDLQALARSDEQELCESRLIILQVGRWHHHTTVVMVPGHRTTSPKTKSLVRAGCGSPGLP
jgi:hypothetical protein